MSAANYIEKMQTLQKSLIDFLDVDQESDESFTNFRIILDSQKNREDKNNLIAIIDMLINIFNNHHRTPFFISKIEQILNYIKESIKQHFTQQEIFNIFKYNKRLLLYFIKGNLITIDENMAETMSLYDPIYFYPEISCFEKAREIMNNNFCNSNAKLLGKVELPENFEELRAKGENEGKICELIRNDSIDDFIVYVNKNNVSLHSTIKSSFYETNSLLLKIQDKLTLIDYAAFFGSIKIFKYLRINGVKLTSSTFLCSIHGNNPEIIYLLEEIKNQQTKLIDSGDLSYYKKRNNQNFSDDNMPNTGSFNYDENLFDDDDFYDDFNNYDDDNDNKKHEKFDDNNDAILSSFDSVLIEAIKCFHNEIANYFISNNNCKDVNKIETALRYHNYELFNATEINQNSFNLLCKYNYIQLVSILSNIFDLSNCFYNGQTPLFAAVEDQNIEIIKILLNNDKIDINYLNDYIQIKFICFNYVQNNFVFLMTFKMNLF